MKIIFDFNQKCFFVNAYRLRTNSRNDHGAVQITTATVYVCLYVCMFTCAVTWISSNPSPKSTMLATLLCRQVHPISQKSTNILVIQKSTQFNVKKIKKQREWQSERKREREVDEGEMRRKWDAFIVIMVFPIFSGLKNTFTHNPHKAHMHFHFTYLICVMYTKNPNPEQQKSPLVSSLQIATA